jgi:hypothetical protein
VAHIDAALSKEDLKELIRKGSEEGFRDYLKFKFYMEKYLSGNPFLL